MLKRTIAVTGIVAIALAVAPTVAHADDLNSCGNLIVNGDYETPDLTGVDWSGIAVGTDGLGWQTGDSNQLIEIWNGLARDWVGRADGDQISEVQYSQIAYVWQDIATTPGDTLDISIEHRGRNGQDHLLINAGPVDGPMTLAVDADDPTDAWYTHTGTYVVPAGQTTTRIQLDPVTYGANGSLVDNVVVTSRACTSADSSGLVNLAAGSEEQLVDTAGRPDTTGVVALGALGIVAAGLAMVRFRRSRALANKR